MHVADDIMVFSLLELDRTKDELFVVKGLAVTRPEPFPCILWAKRQLFVARDPGWIQVIGLEQLLDKRRQILTVQASY